MKKWLILALLSFCSISAFTVERNVTLYVEEMNCQLCVYLVNKELRAINGVLSTKANFNTRLVKVIANEKVTNDMLIQAINHLHYQAIVEE